MGLTDNRRLGAALLLAALLVVVVTAAIATPLFFRAQRARADATRLTAAESSLDAALLAVDEVRDGYLPHPASEDSEFAPVLDRLSGALTDVNAAEAQARGLWPSRGRTRYLEAIAKTRAAANGLIEYVKAARTARDAIADADAAYARGDAAYAAAMAAGDANDFGKMRAEARKAKALFEQARQLHSAAERVYPGSSFADWIDDSRLSAEMAGVAIEMAHAGAANRVGDYNAGIDRLAELERERQRPGASAEGAAEDPEARVLAATAAAVKDARRLRAEALVELRELHTTAAARLED